MSEIRRVATVFYRYRPSPDFQTFRFIVQELLAEGKEVHCLCSSDLRLAEHPSLHLHFLRFPHWLSKAWYLRALFELVAPFVLCRLVWRVSADAILNTKCEWSFISAPAKFFTGRPLFTFVDATPWTIRRFSRKAKLRKFFGLAVDCLGLVASNTIIAATSTIGEEIKKRIPFAAEKVREMSPNILTPLSIPRTNAGELSLEPWKTWINAQPKRRRELAKKYQLPERCTLLVAPVDLVDPAQLETVLRAVSFIEEDKLVLFLCGTSAESQYIQAITSGLGLGDQVIFVENRDEVPEILAGTDLYVYPLRFSGGSRLLEEALGSGATVIAVAAEESREILRDEQLLFPPADVQTLFERLQQAIEDKQQAVRLRDISRERAVEISQSWGRQFAQVAFEVS